MYNIIESCGLSPYLGELFARGVRELVGMWKCIEQDYYPKWDTYANHSRTDTLPLRQIAKGHLD